MTVSKSPHGKVALAFAEALVAGKFDAASEMLSEAQRSDWSAFALQTRYEAMLDYTDTDPDEIELMQTLEDWPGRLPGDWGWAYVAINGDCFGEAVAVVVTEENGMGKIRMIEWGRP